MAPRRNKRKASTTPSTTLVELESIAATSTTGDDDLNVGYFTEYPPPPDTPRITGSSTVDLTEVATPIAPPPTLNKRQKLTAATASPTPSSSIS